MAAVVHGAASPRPPSNPKDENRGKTLLHLMQMHKAGLFTKQEIRKMVFSEMGMDCQTPKEVECVKVKDLIHEEVVEMAVIEPRREATKEESQQKNAKPSPRIKNKSTTEKKKQTRTSAPTTVKELRNYVKNATRQRFFAECLNPDSVLWFKTPGGKSMMNRILFDRARKDVITKIYAESPGPMRKIPEPKLKSLIHWQVMKDRNNFKTGNVPKRNAFTGEPSPFDFEKEKQLIDEAIANSEDLTCDIDTSDEDDIEQKPKIEAKPQIKTNPEEDVSTLSSPCNKCRVTVWMGSKQSCPKNMFLAFPLNSDWHANVNVRPYCEKCWEAEEKFMQQLGNEHCAVGPKKRKTNFKGGEQQPKKKTPKRKTQRKKKTQKQTKNKPKTTKPKTQKRKTPKAPKTKTPKTAPSYEVRISINYTSVFQHYHSRHRCLSLLRSDNAFLQKMTVESFLRRSFLPRMLMGRTTFTSPKIHKSLELM